MNIWYKYQRNVTDNAEGAEVIKYSVITTEELFINKEEYFTLPGENYNCLCFIIIINGHLKQILMACDRNIQWQQI